MREKPVHIYVNYTVSAQFLAFLSLDLLAYQRSHLKTQLKTAGNVGAEE